MRNSLAVRLLFALVLPMSAFAVVLGGGGAFITQQVVNRSADRLQAGAIRAIAETMSVEDGKVRANIPPWALGVLGNPERDRVYYSVRQSGRLLTGYDDLPQTSPSPAQDEPEFGYAVYKGARVRNASQSIRLVGADAPVVVSIAQSLDSRNVVRGELMRGLLLLEGLLIVMAAGLVWPAVRWNLRPLDVVRRRLQARATSRSNRYRPVELEAVPTEIKPLLEAFNGLLLELGEANESVRRFTADASHQMRTPLTILKMHLALMQGRSRRSASDKAALADAREAASRLERLLLQLLALARADNSELVRNEPLDLVEHARMAVDVMAPAAASMGATLRFDPQPGEARASAQPEFLAEMLGNLLDNAIRYGAGMVEVTIVEIHGRPAIRIDDNGPGIAESEREAVFSRFSRLSATQHIPGSGLGLSIVRTMAERQHAHVELGQSTCGGLRVTVSFDAEA